MCYMFCRAALFGQAMKTSLRLAEYEDQSALRDCSEDPLSSEFFQDILDTQTIYSLIVRALAEA